MTTTLDYSLYLSIAGRFMQIGVFAVFVAGCYRLWRITCRISYGFDLIGRIVTLVLFSALLLMAFGPERVVLFRIIVYSSLTSWLYYTTWYFKRYPIPSEYLTVKRLPVVPGQPVFMPKQALLRYLIGASPVPAQPWWFGHTFRNILIVSGGVMLLGYGFVQTINGYSWGFLEVAKVKREAVMETRRAVSTAVNAAVDSTRKAISEVTDTLRKGQDELDRKIETNNKRAQATAAAVKKDLNRTNARLSRPALIIVAPEAKGLNSSPAFTLPPLKAVPVETKPRRRGKGYGYDYEPQEYEADSIRLARMW